MPPPSPPPSPPPLCAGFGSDAQDPGADGSVMRLRYGATPTHSAALALVHGVFRISARARAYIDADDATSYPRELQHTFTLNFRVERGLHGLHTPQDGDGRLETAEGFAGFERTLVATGLRPSHAHVGAPLEFAQSGVALVPGEHVRLWCSSARAGT
jgi:hypothetical protein